MCTSQTFLLFQNTEISEWSRYLAESRSFYSEQGDHFLKFIKHPEELAKVAIDPLTDDPKVSVAEFTDTIARRLTQLIVTMEHRSSGRDHPG